MNEKHFLFILILLFFGLNTYSQNQKADSLQTIFESKTTDSERLLVCKQLTSILAGIDSAKAEAFILKGIGLSEKLSDTEARMFFESQRARILLDRNLHDEAIDLCEQMLSKAEKENYRSVEGNCNEILGNIYLQQRNFIKAKYYLEKELAYHENNDHTEKIASALSALGIVHEQLGNLTEALIYLNKSLSITKDLGDQQATALNIRYLGAVYSTQGLFEKALQHYEKSLEIEKKINNQIGIASCLHEISTIYSHLGNYKKANLYCEKAIKIYRENDQIEKAILLTSHIGSNYIMTGSYDKAVTYLNDAVKQAKNTNNMHLVSGFYMNLAILFAEQGNFEKGIEYFTFSLDLVKETGNKSKILTILNNLGYTYQLMGNYEKALSFYKKCLNYNDSSQILTHAKTLSNIGHSYLKLLNNEDSAFIYLNRANGIYEKLGNDRKLRNNLEETGRWYTSQGQIPKALQFYYRALALAEESQDTLGIAHVYDDFASVHEVQNNWIEAIAYQHKALIKYESISYTSGIASTKIALANLFIKTADYMKALDYASQALISFQLLKDSCQFSDSFLFMGKAHLALNKTDSALYYLGKAVNQAEKCFSNNILAQSYLALGKIYHTNKESAKALNAYQQALEFANSSRDRKLIQEAAAYLFPIYQQKRDFRKAFETLNLYQSNKDSLFNADNTRNLVQKEMEYTYAKAEQEKALVRHKEEALEAQKLQRQTLFTYMFVGGFIAMLLIALAFYRNYRNKQKANVLLTKQKEELKELDHVKSRLFANISHELRTPITLISSPVKSLLNNGEVLSQATREKLELVNRNSQQLKGLVDDILDLSKLEANKIELYQEKVAVEPLLRKVFSNFDSLAKHLGIQYTIQLNPVANKWAMLDSAKVEKVLNNLLSNAIKHTPSGGKVTLNADQTDGKILLQVVDTGQGIAAADLPLIFDRFFQSKQPNAPIQGGTGIGLALAKELTHLMNGEIQVESELGSGSQFSVVIPYQATSEPHLQAEANQEDEEEVSLVHLDSSDMPESEKQFNVLIVEDNPDMQQFISGLLKHKYHVHLAGNGKDALYVLEQNKIDLVVSDVMMPEMDGYELLKRLKDSETLLHIPVIMLTALDSEDSKLNALTLGVDDYLTKPFSPQELLARVHNLLLRHEIRLEARQMEDQLILEATKNGELDGVTLHEKENEDNNLAVHQNDVEWLEQVAKAIRQELENTEYQMADLAEQFNISDRQLYRRIKKITGMPPKKYQQEIALLKARGLLEKGIYGNVTAICFSIGMSNVSRFSQLYEARFGKKPKEYFGAAVG